MWGGGELNLLAVERLARGQAEALPLAQRADSLQVAAGVQDDRPEGRVAELLLQLPEEDT